HRLAIDQHGAGAAHPVLAADVGAGLSAVLADRIDQRAARLDADRVRLPVDRQRDVASFAHPFFVVARRSAARMRRGVARGSSIVTPNGASASLMALRTAAGAPMAPPSPRPLACVRVVPSSVSRWSTSIGGISRLVGGRKSANVAVRILPPSS